MAGYMEKAVREAKTRTSWTDPNDDYEQAVFRLVSAALSKESGGAFLEDFAKTCRLFWTAGAINSLSRLALKLAAPGVPDIYQGSELWDFSLVDPDNRRPVDFDARQRLLAAIREMKADQLLDDWRSGAPKLAVTAAGLRMRRAVPALFTEGAYIPLHATGSSAGHIVAFARRLEDAAVLVVVPRFVLSLSPEDDRPHVSPTFWNDTVVRLPEGWRPFPMRDIVTGAVHPMDREVRIATLLQEFPVALLTNSP